MSNTISHLETALLDKAVVLQEAKNKLKQEFIGIDSIIDEIIENVRSWYLFPELQDKPLVINLWGLTGTGKTSLINRLLHLIGFSEKMYRFDLGEKHSEYSLKSAMSELSSCLESEQIAIVLDEFQHARTLKGLYREEVDTDYHRILWELIDSGKIERYTWESDLYKVKNLKKQLSILLDSGVEVKQGVVVKNKDLFTNEMSTKYYYKDNNELFFIPRTDYEAILDLIQDHMNIKLYKELKAHLLRLNGPQSIQFLQKVILIAAGQKYRSLTKSIVFVVGNIDEAYTMSGNYNSDISADEFHKASLKITVPDMKKALRTRFRDEQIARLGNIHIIYPAFSSKSFVDLIHLELNKIKANVKALMRFELQFHESLIQEIYKEGVYPTQGARPLFTTIYQMVKSKLGTICTEILKHNLKCNQLELKVQNKNLIASFYNASELVHTFSSAVNYKLDNLRKPKRDESQAITAVHEAGHAVLSMALLNEVPEAVVSVTTDSRSSGFTYTNSTKKHYSRMDILPKTATFLAGIVAEELVFGYEHLTAGGDSDIENATSFLMQLFKNEGFGAIPMNYAMSVDQMSHSYHDVQFIENQVAEYIKQAKQLALNELTKHKSLLLAIANYLSDYNKLEKNELIEFAKNYSNLDFSNNQKSTYYRTTLKTQFSSIQNATEQLANKPIVLNKAS